MDLSALSREDLIGQIGMLEAEIQRRVQSENVLREREGRLQALLDIPIDPICLIDMEGTIFAGNRALAEALGGTVDELIGERLYHLLPPDWDQTTRSLVDGVLRTGRPASLQAERAGQVAHHRVQPVLDSQGALRLE